MNQIIQQVLRDQQLSKLLDYKTVSPLLGQGSHGMHTLQKQKSQPLIHQCLD